MICQKCGIRVVRRSNAQKYCKRCAKYVRYYREMMRLRRKRSLGNSSLWEHRHSDFDKEYEAIKREKKRLGI